MIVIITSGSITYIDPPQLDGHFIYRKYNRLDYYVVYNCYNVRSFNLYVLRSTYKYKSVLIKSVRRKKSLREN